MPTNLAAVYALEMALLAPFRAMTARGLRVHDALRRERIGALAEEGARLLTAAQPIVESVLDKLKRRDLVEWWNTCKVCRNGKRKRLSCEACGHLGRTRVFSFNLASEKQLKDALYEGLKLPVRSRDRRVTTDEEALESLLALDKSGLVQLALRHSKLDTMRAIYERLAPAPDGAVRTVLNPAGTYTGRPTSAEAFYVPHSTNLHNLVAEEARHDPLFAVRDVIVPDEGEVFVYADLSQAEARVVAALSEDSALLKHWARDPEWDLHRWTAAHITGKPEAAVTAMERQLQGKRPRHCLTPDTFVLTQAGWCAFEDLVPGVPIAQWEIGSGEIAFVVPELNSYLVDEELYVWEGTAISQAVTREHRLPIWANKVFDVRTAEQLAGCSWARIPVCGVFAGGCSPGLAFVRLLAATQADGTVATRRVAFHLKKQRKIKRLKTLAREAGAAFREYKRRDGTTYISLDREISERLLGWLPGKKFGAELLALSPTARCVLLDELHHWDGGLYRYKSTTHREAYYTAVYSNAIWVQTLAHLTGREALVRQRPDKCYEVSFNRRKFARLPAVQRTTYDGRVYCATVPSGFFLVRRHDRISVTGNSLNYGMGAGKFWRVLNAAGAALKRSETDAIYKGYHALHPNLDKVWWERVEAQLTHEGAIETCFGRRLNFYPRFDPVTGALDPETLRAAIAAEPQSTVADLANRAVVALFALEAREGFQLRHHALDAILASCRPARVASVARLLKEGLECELNINGTTIVVPAHVYVAPKNWSELERIL